MAVVMGFIGEERKCSEADGWWLTAIDELLKVVPAENTAPGVVVYDRVMIVSKHARRHCVNVVPVQYLDGRETHKNALGQALDFGSAPMKIPTQNTIWVETYKFARLLGPCSLKVPHPVTGPSFMPNIIVCRGTRRIFGANSG
jgi:hypothetical protein